MVAAPPITSGLKGGGWIGKNIYLRFLRLKEELRLSGNSESVVWFLVRVSIVGVRYRYVGLVNDLSRIEGLSRLIVDIPSQEFK